MNLKKWVLSILCIAALMLSMLSISAEEMEKEKVYKPLDLVVILDSSGSMRESDPKRTAVDAVRMLVNMMPAASSRVGIVSFNKKATVLTRDASGNEALIPLEELSGVESIRSSVDEVKYNGGTGIGNALIAGTELLNRFSNDEHAQAVILFTDGVDDFGGDRISLAECEANEAAAIKWAQESGCPVYCVGYDYISSSGKRSMGSGGEGLIKLSNISDRTGGTFRSINSISEIEQLLIEFLADVCDLNYKTVATIPGDGGYHECVIHVSPAVIEANIRIAHGNQEAFSKGDIHLYDPAGNEIQLRNGGKVRYDTDATAASIKVIMPETGDWLLTVNGVHGDDIHVGLLEHFSMDLKSKLIFPEGNPEGVAYTNDEVGIETTLIYEGRILDNEEIYDAVTSAVAVVQSRLNPDEKETVRLVRDGYSFKGSFVVKDDSYYDITIRLDWDTVYRQDKLTVRSSNSPVRLVNDIEDVEVRKGRTVTIENIYKYVYDEENDDVTASVKSYSAPGVADVAVDGDKLNVTGVKGWWKSTLVTVEYKDAQGNTVESTFTVKVKDPVATAITVCLGIALLAAVLLLLKLLKRMAEHPSGKIKVSLISKGFINSSGNFENEEIVYRNPNITEDEDIVMAAPRTEVHEQEDGPQFTGGGAFGGLTGSGTGGDGGYKGTFGGFGTGLPGQTGSRSGGLSGTEKKEEKAVSGLFGGLGGDVPQDGEEKEKARSDRFDQEIDLFSRRIHKMYLSDVTARFLSYYREYMDTNEEAKSGRLYDKVSAFVTGNFDGIFKQITLWGTAYGRSGVIFEPKKSLISKQLVVHSPILYKKRVSMNPGRRSYLISVSLPQGGKDERGNIPGVHMEMKYYR